MGMMAVFCMGLGSIQTVAYRRCVRLTVIAGDFVPPVIFTASRCFVLKIPGLTLGVGQVVYFFSYIESLHLTVAQSQP